MSDKEVNLVEQVTVEAELRTQHGGALAQLRNLGQVPAVLYGRQAAPVSIVVPERVLDRAQMAEGNLVALQIEGREVHAFLQEIQRDAVTRRILHADFHQVDLSARVDLRIPLRLHGTDQVERRGGIVQQQTRYLEVRAVPAETPEYISVDAGDLEIGDHIEVAQVMLPPGVELRTDSHVVVVSVVAPKQVTAVADIEAEAQPTE